jgi:putative nucleotidyltransferase with HDIG domain
MNSPEKPSHGLELVPGGASGASPEAISRELQELSPDALETIASDAPLVPPREPLGARLASYFGRHQLLLFVASFFALWAIVAAPFNLSDPQIQLGARAPRDIVAPQNAYVPDRAETERRRNNAAALVTPAYAPNPGALAQALAELPAFVDEARQSAALSRRERLRRRTEALAQSANVDERPKARVDESVPRAQTPIPLETVFARRAGWTPSSATLIALENLPAARWKTLEARAETAIRAAYLGGRVRSDVRADFVALRPILRGALEKPIPDALSPAEIETALALSMRAAQFPNVVINERATEAARREARASVLPVFSRVEANTPLVREGERISAATWSQLQALGLVTPRFRPFEALAYGALCLMLVSGAAAYLGHSRRDVLERPAALWLVAVIPVLFLALFRVILRVPHADFLMVPLAATAAMLITVLLDTRIGLPAGFVVAALCALMGRAEAALFLAATLSAWIGALSVARLSSRFALARSLVIMAATNATLAGSIATLGEARPDALLSSMMWSGAAGVGSVVAMAGLAIFLERPFGITSHLRLLELLSPDELVIRRMQVEAPGTYTHSLMVATLAEAAAKNVGADSLLCRVAGLYHDIGKLRRPHCFIENQSGENIHDRLSPALSALLIKAHVKDGLELGRAIRLPAPVMEIVASHHGTGVLAYFVHRARQLAQQNGEDPALVDESTFRYSGPRPRTKEAAIVMLADGVEASARSLGSVSPEALEAHIASIVTARLNEGELSECDLSLREIRAVQDALLATLRGAMHGRIAYPDPAALEREGEDNWVAETLGAASVARRDERKGTSTPKRRATDSPRRAACRSCTRRGAARVAQRPQRSTFQAAFQAQNLCDSEKPPDAPTKDLNSNG